MRIKVLAVNWYSNKARFVKLYKSLGYRWKEGTKDGDGWFSPGGTSYILKIAEDENYKYFFSKDAGVLLNFIISIGELDEKISTLIVTPDVITIPECRGYGIDLCVPYQFNINWQRLTDNFGVIWK